VHSIGWTALGAGARGTGSWKMGAQRHREPKKYSWKNELARVGNC